MKPALLALALLLLALSALPAGDDMSDFAILTIGDYHGNELAIDSSLAWYGVFARDSGTVVEQIGLVVTRCVDVIVDEATDTTGYCVATGSGETPLFLIGSRAPLAERLVRPLHATTQNWLTPGNVINIGDFTLAALGEITDEGDRMPYDLLTVNYRVRLYNDDDSSRSQTLVEIERLGADATPSVIWAGDLDGDRRTDLLLDITNHYNVRHLALFLSREAAPGELVKRVAELRTTGC